MKAQAYLSRIAILCLLALPAASVGIRAGREIIRKNR